MLNINKNHCVAAAIPIGGFASGHMQYDENRLARLAATIAAGLAVKSRFLENASDKERARAEARSLAKVSVIQARHVRAAAQCAAQKGDELEMRYDAADVL